jgi:hypothetical protein
MARVPERCRRSSDSGWKAGPVITLPICLELDCLRFLYRDANATVVTTADQEVHCDRDLSATVVDGVPDEGPEFALLDEEWNSHCDYFQY